MSKVLTCWLKTWRFGYVTSVSDVSRKIFPAHPPLKGGFELVSYRQPGSTFVEFRRRDERRNRVEEDWEIFGPHLFRNCEPVAPSEKTLAVMSCVRFLLRARRPCVESLLLN